MNYTKRYVVYETTRINYEPIDRTETLALCPVKFTGFISNSFETEQEAIETCVEQGIKYQNILIIPQIYITDY